MKNDYSSNMTLFCPVCGCTEFKFDSEKDNRHVRCMHCSCQFLRSEIIVQHQKTLSMHELGIFQ